MSVGIISHKWMGFDSYTTPSQHHHNNHTSTPHMSVGPSVWGPPSCEGLLCGCCIGVVNLTFSLMNRRNDQNTYDVQQLYNNKTHWGETQYMSPTKKMLNLQHQHNNPSYEGGPHTLGPTLMWGVVVTVLCMNQILSHPNVSCCCIIVVPVVWLACRCISLATASFSSVTQLNPNSLFSSLYLFFHQIFPSAETLKKNTLFLGWKMY
jgi:hypothetical protein